MYINYEDIFYKIMKLILIFYTAELIRNSKIIKFLGRSNEDEILHIYLIHFL